MRATRLRVSLSTHLHQIKHCLKRWLHKKKNNNKQKCCDQWSDESAENMANEAVEWQQLRAMWAPRADFDIATNAALGITSTRGLPPECQAS